MLSSLQSYADDLKNVIRNKIQFVPFTFNIKPSLFFDQALKES